MQKALVSGSSASISASVRHSKSFHRLTLTGHVLPVGLADFLADAATLPVVVHKFSPTSLKAGSHRARSLCSSASCSTPISELNLRKASAYFAQAELDRRFRP